ncbi:MAG: DM13 domain-containing protein, partial [Bacteroidota bacterium]
PRIKVKRSHSIYLLIALLFSACIGNDIVLDTVEEAVKITKWVDTLGVNDNFPFEARYTDLVGQTVDANVTWSSADPSILTISNEGVAEGLTMGSTMVFAQVQGSEGSLMDSIPVTVAEETSAPPSEDRAGTIKTTSSYVLEGSFTITVDGPDLVITFADDYKASSSLPGLYLYMTNNVSTNNGALEIGEVKDFDGAHTYRVEGVDISEYDHLLYYCKPFNVKVGDGDIGQ